jgi:hypothetical protein
VSLSGKRFGDSTFTPRVIVRHSLKCLHELLQLLSGFHVTSDPFATYVLCGPINPECPSLGGPRSTRQFCDASSSTMTRATFSASSSVNARRMPRIEPSPLRKPIRTLSLNSSASDHAMPDSGERNRNIVKSRAATLSACPTSSRPQPARSEKGRAFHRFCIGIEVEALGYGGTYDPARQAIAHAVLRMNGTPPPPALAA